MQKFSSNSDDIYQIGFTAKLLETSEFKLFGDAYRTWYGEEISDKLLECCFNRYLLNNIVPFWVRSYVRKFFYDPDLQEHLDKKRKVAACCYIVPIVVEYVVVIYFLL